MFTRPRGGFWFALVLTGLITALSLYFLIQGLADPRSRALVPEDTPPEKAVEALKAMPETERAALLAREQAALHSNLLDIKALKNLLVLAEVAGDPNQVQALTRLAADRNLRDVGVQAVLLQVLLNAKDYRGALYRLDGLTRARPAEIGNLLPSLASFALEGERRGALVEVLKTNPPWRARLIDHVTSGSFDVAAAYQLITELRQAGSPVSDQQLGLMVDRLVNIKEYDKAYFIWLNSLSEAELRRAGTVFDGDFKADIVNRIFDWTFRPMDNVELRLTPRAAGSADQVVRIDFAPGRTAFANLFQYIRLSPGTHILTGEGKTEDLANAGGLVWRIHCAGQAGPPLAESPALRDTMAWAPFEAAFTVPDSGCDTQILRLELSARTALDQEISGRAFYDNIAVTKRESAPPGP